MKKSRKNYSPLFKAKVALGSPNEIKNRFSNTGVTEITVKVPKQGLVDELSHLDGVQRATSGTDGLFQRITLYTLVGVDLETKIRELIGEEGIENLVSHEPTLEEAYVSILR